MTDRECAFDTTVEIDHNRQANIVAWSTTETGLSSVAIHLYCMFSNTSISGISPGQARQMGEALIAAADTLTAMDAPRAAETNVCGRCHEKITRYPAPSGVWRHYLGRPADGHAATPANLEETVTS